MSLKKIILFLIGLFVLIQFVPYGRDHINPKVVSQPQWDSEQTKTMFFNACADCHSNETKWPWYSNIAPLSWGIYHHVQEGREHFNVSMWGVQKKNEGDEAAEEVEEGEMPLSSYLLLHSEARLNKTQKEKFIEGLKKTFGSKDEDDD